MTLARLKDLLALPGLIVGAVTLIIVAATWLQRATNVGARLDAHLTADTAYHRKVLVGDSIRFQIHELHGHALLSESLLDALIRGECIENPKKNLQRQGLIAKCIQLGITP